MKQNGAKAGSGIHALLGHRKRWAIYAEAQRKVHDLARLIEFWGCQKREEESKRPLSLTTT